jgi:uncharacterized protein YndB with AHSA1/START domain
MSDKIEKSVDLNAPVARVWKALTDHEEFGRWFRANEQGWTLQIKNIAEHVGHAA